MTLMSTSEVAHVLGVTPQTVSHLAQRGLLQGEFCGNRRAFKDDAVARYLSDNNLSPAPADHARATDKVPEIVALSFFSGAMGLDIGLARAGIVPLLHCENDTKCRMTIESNRPDAALIGDIEAVDGSTARKLARMPDDHEIDVMAGGPPCQAFSTAGARRAFADSRGNVFLRYLDLAEELRPRYLVIENVRGLLSTAYPLRKGEKPMRGGALRLILDRLSAMGYGVSFNLYNAANFGAPQIRERVIVIAKRDGDVMPWLTPTHSADPAWGLPSWRTFGEATAHLQGRQHYSQFPERRLRFFRLLSEGQYWRDLPPSLQEEAMGKAYRLSGGKTGFYRRIRVDRPCPTLVTSPTMPATDLCHPTEDRPLSVEEYKAIQEFPEQWIIRGNLTDRYRQLGNAVPIALGEAVGRAIIDDMAGRQADDRFREFPYSRYKHTSNISWDIA